MISCRSEGDPMAGEPTALVSTEWLAEHLHDPAIRIVDGTYFLPTVPRDAAAEFAERHIPGAVFFDIDAIKDHGNPLPHMLPEPAEFAARVGALGLGDETTIIAYDAHGVMSAARVWWMFRVMGHDAVAVLDGGLPKWLREGRPLAAGPAKPRQRALHAALPPRAGVRSRRRQGRARDRLEAACRRPLGCPLCGQRAGIPPRAQERPYAGGQKPALWRSAQPGRDVPPGLGDPRTLSRRRRRSRAAGHGFVRLGRFGLRAGARALPDRQARCGRL